MPTTAKRKARKPATPSTPTAKPAAARKVGKGLVRKAEAAPEPAPEQKRGPGRPPLEGGEGRPFSIYMDPVTRARVMRWADARTEGRISAAFREMSEAAGDPPALT